MPRYEGDTKRNPYSVPDAENPFIGMEVSALEDLIDKKNAESLINVRALHGRDEDARKPFYDEIRLLRFEIQLIFIAIARANEPDEPDTPEVPEQPDRPGAGYPDIWHLWNERKRDELGKVFPPPLDISGVEFDQDGWSVEADENRGWIYKPVADRYQQMLNSGHRDHRYAAHLWAEYHYKWITCPPASDSDMLAFVKENYSEAQENRPFIFNHKAGWMPVKAWAEWEDNEPVPGTWLQGYALVWYGNCRDRSIRDPQERMASAIDGARRAFEAYVKDGRINTAALTRARYVLRELDRYYSYLDTDAERLKFVADHPHYEPPA